MQLNTGVFHRETVCPDLHNPLTWTTPYLLVRLVVRLFTSSYSNLWNPNQHLTVYFLDRVESLLKKVGRLYSSWCVGICKRLFLPRWNPNDPSYLLTLANNNKFYAGIPKMTALYQLDGVRKISCVNIFFTNAAGLIKFF